MDLFFLFFFQPPPTSTTCWRCTSTGTSWAGSRPSSGAPSSSSSSSSTSFSASSSSKSTAPTRTSSDQGTSRALIHGISDGMRVAWTRKKRKNMCLLLILKLKIHACMHIEKAAWEMIENLQAVKNAVSRHEIFIPPNFLLFFIGWLTNFLRIAHRRKNQFPTRNCQIWFFDTFYGKTYNMSN